MGHLISIIDSNLGKMINADFVWDILLSTISTHINYYYIIIIWQSLLLKLAYVHNQDSPIFSIIYLIKQYLFHFKKFTSLSHLKMRLRPSSLVVQLIIIKKWYLFSYFFCGAIFWNPSWYYILAYCEFLLF